MANITWAEKPDLSKRNTFYRSSGFIRPPNIIGFAIVAREGNRRLVVEQEIELTPEQLALIEEATQKAWEWFEEKAETVEAI